MKKFSSSIVIIVLLVCLFVSQVSVVVPEMLVRESVEHSERCKDRVECFGGPTVESNLLSFEEGIVESKTSVADPFREDGTVTRPTGSIRCSHHETVLSLPDDEYKELSRTTMFSETTAMFSEDFEGAFPGDNWLVGDSNPSSGEDYWDDTSYRSHGGSWSGWCSDVGDTAPSHLYDNNMYAYMVRKYVMDASGWYSAALSFYAWCKTESGVDYCRVFVTGDAGSHWDEIENPKLYGDHEYWSKYSVTIPDAYLTNLFSVGFVFRSDGSGMYEGVYIDDITLERVEPNNPPDLTEGLVDPTTGYTDTNFKFLVKYTDPDGDPAAIKRIYVYDSGWQYFEMDHYVGNPIDGEWFICWLTGFSVGSHNFFFYFTDGELETYDPESGYYSFDVIETGIPPDLTIYDPEIDGLTVTVNGAVYPGTPGTTITRIHWDWGDGNSEDHWFPASHTYADYGSYTITVTAYQSDGLSATETKPVSLPPPPDFTVSVSPTSRTIIQGESTTFTVTVTSVNGFNSPVTLSVYRYINLSLTHVLKYYPAAGILSSYTWSFNLNPVTPPPDGSIEFILTLETTPDIAPGTYDRFYVRGKDGGITHSSNTFKFIVEAPPAGPDLIVEDIWWDPVEPVSGQPFDIYFRIKNQGDGDAVETFRSKLFIDSSYYGYGDNNGLSAGSTFNWYAPDVVLGGGNHTIKVVVDADNAIEETDETNNERSETCPVTTPTRIYVTIKNLDDDVHSVQIYIDGEVWGELTDIPHFATYSTPDIEVVGDMDHEVEIVWLDADDMLEHSKSLIKYVGSGEKVEFAIELDPILELRMFDQRAGILQKIWERFLDLDIRIAYADFYGLSSDGNFEIYFEKDDPQITSEYLSTVEAALVLSWSKLVLCLLEPGQTPYDQDGDGRITVLIANINEWPEETEPRNAGGYVAPIGADPNGLGVIYLDEDINDWRNWNALRSTCSHEFTHLIQLAYNRDESWLMEGMAQFCADYVWGIDGQLQDAVNHFANNPDVQLNYNWLDEDKRFASFYCASYVFHEFLAEKFGQSIMKTLLEKTVDYDGRFAVEQATEKSFSDLFDEFAVWNYVNEYSGTSDGGITFEGTDIHAEPFETHYLPRPPAYLHGSGSFGDRTYTTDCINFTNLVEPFVEVTFYGDLGRAYKVRVILVVGDFSSYEVRDIPLSNNEGSLLIEDASTYSQFALVVVRRSDDYSEATYSWDAKALTEPKLTVTAHSPVNILVTAPNGLRVGYDPETGTVVNEIPNATYSGPGSEPQIISIPNPLTGNYTIDAFGTGTGEYTITLQSTASNGSIIDVDTWQGTAAPDEQYTETVRLDSEGRLIWPHDIEVTNLLLSKTVIGQGYCINLTATITNWGDFTESFNVSVFYDDTIIILPDGKNYTTTTLTSGNSTTITFTWNTTGFAKGNYIISAYAWPVPGETDKTDNTLVYGTVKVTIPGDVDGNFEVDIYDVTAICVCYDSKIGPPPDPLYYPNCDLDGNGIIDIYDVTTACITYEQKYP